MPQGTTRYCQGSASSRQLKNQDIVFIPSKLCLELGPLDMAAAEPVPAAVVVGGIGAGDGALTAANPEEANEGRDEPEKCREEAEGDGGLELAALIAVNRMNVAPVEHATARVSNQLEVTG